ncbi:hypothetical protein GOBAR_DD25764 [Gossypium barbadense]|nr:hypothetical protein GOBAR_DD25764 [Gossypium barbadense]
MGVKQSAKGMVGKEKLVRGMVRLKGKVRVKEKENETFRVEEREVERVWHRAKENEEEKDRHRLGRHVGCQEPVPTVVNGERWFGGGVAPSPNGN